MKTKLLAILWTLLSSHFAIAITEQEQSMLKEHGLMGPKILLHTDTWSVKPSKIDVDGDVFKGQSKSMIDWSVDHYTWLDFNYWKQQRAARDEQPDWKIRLRESQHVESIGKVIKCYGVCNVYRERNSVNADYMSRIYEGDELITGEHSYAWVALTDGSVFRISPKSSITFNEINIGVNDYFYFARLNHGHIHWQMRKAGKYEEQNLAETDLIFLPLMLKEANREYFARKEFESMNHSQSLLYHTRKNPGHTFQYQKLNEYLAQDSEVLNRKNTKVFIITANSSYWVDNAHFDLFYGTNGNAKFKFKSTMEGFENSDERVVSVTAFLRGYNNKTEETLSENTWYLVEKEGSSITESDFTEQFKTIDLFTKRTPTILLAREIMIREDFKHILVKEDNEKDMAVKYGYRLWDQDGKEFKQRLAFLKEYTRRTETTNISSMAKVFKDRDPEEFDSTYYHRALSEHMKKLKNLYSKSRAVIPELNELQYYIWILKYAKKE
jgi:hypothetical protein